MKTVEIEAVRRRLDYDDFGRVVYLVDVMIGGTWRLVIDEDGLDEASAQEIERAREVL